MKGLKFKLDQENLRTSVGSKAVQVPWPKNMAQAVVGFGVDRSTSITVLQGLRWMGKAPMQLWEGEHLLSIREATFEEARQARDTCLGI